MVTLFKQQTKQQLIQAANAYARLLGTSFVLESPSFQNRSRYVIRFFATNFLHLAGVETDLSSGAFFEKCLSSQIDYDEFWDSPRKNKNTIRKKLRNLVHIDMVLVGDILVQEDFVKNTVRCVIATTDGRCTIGFVDNRHYVVPNTILDGNHLDENKPVMLTRALFR